MRYALVDDATLEAAKRMEGRAVTQNPLVVAGDILALDNLVQAILYCDQILYLDDNGKKNNCRFKMFRRIRLDEKVSERLLLSANQMTDEYLPCIEGGKITDECFGAFFKALDMDIRFVWEKRADIYRLAPRIIRKEKDSGRLLYKKLLNMLLAELSDKSFLGAVKPRIPLLYDSEGQIINNCYTVKGKDGKEYPTKLSPQTEALFKALNYMAFRSNLHLLAANELKADLVLSPMRSLFQLGSCNFTADMPHRSMFFQELPLFLFWIAKHMGEGSDLIRAVYELREEKEFAAARRYLAEISEIAEAGCGDDAKDMDSAMLKLNEIFRRIAKKYRLNSGKGTSAAPFALIRGVSPSHVKLPLFEDPSFRLRTEKPAIGFGRRKYFGVICRSVREDLIYMDTLSEYSDAITSKINYKTEAILRNIRVESDETFNGQHGRTAPV